MASPATRDKRAGPSLAKARTSAAVGCLTYRLKPRRTPFRRPLRRLRGTLHCVSSRFRSEDRRLRNAPVTPPANGHEPRRLRPRAWWVGNAGVRSFQVLSRQCSPLHRSAFRPHPPASSSGGLRGALWRLLPRSAHRRGLSEVKGERPNRTAEHKKKHHENPITESQGSEPPRTVEHGSSGADREAPGVAAD